MTGSLNLLGFKLQHYYALDHGCMRTVIDIHNELLAIETLDLRLEACDLKCLMLLFPGEGDITLDFLLYVISRGIVYSCTSQSMHNTMIKLVYELVILTPPSSSGSIILPYILRSYARMHTYEW